MGQLDGKVAVITGAGRGIGQAIAQRYAAEGARIVVSSRTEKDLKETLKDVKKKHGAAVIADAMTPEGSRAPIEKAIEKFGRIDILVNNVGGTIPGNPDPFVGDDDFFLGILQLNLFSAWWSTTAALPHFRKANYGRVISIGSGASKNSGSSVPYATAKHGLVGFTKEIARLGAPFGINANLLCPGWTRTSLVDFERIAKARGTTPSEEEARAASESLQGRVLDPTELTGMALLLAGPDGSGITGQVISVDGGHKV